MHLDLLHLLQGKYKYSHGIIWKLASYSFCESYQSSLSYRLQVLAGKESWNVSWNFHSLKSIRLSHLKIKSIIPSYYSKLRGDWLQSSWLILRVPCPRGYILITKRGMQHQKKGTEAALVSNLQNDQFT